MSVAEIFETMDYGPAPESAGLANAWLDARGRKFGLFVDGVWREPATGQWFDTINPATTKTLAAVAQSGAADVDAAVAAARAAQPGWAKLGGHGRARRLYALARLVQKHARLLAVLETMDNGKPIRETRDIDVPLVARHFYHHAGWAQLQATELAGYEALGVVGQVIPWNFPLLMLAWKIAPGDRHRQHRRAEAGRVHQPHGPRLRRAHSRGRAAAGRRQHRHRRRHDGRADRQPRRRRQARLHRLDRGRPPDPYGDRRHGQEADPGARRQVAVHRLRRCRPRQRRRGRRRRDLVQPRARSAAPARACCSRNPSPTP